MALYEYMLIWYDGPQVWLESDENTSDAWLCYNHDSGTYSQDLMVCASKAHLKDFFQGKIPFKDLLLKSSKNHIRRHHGKNKDFEFITTLESDFEGFMDLFWTKNEDESDWFTDDAVLWLS